MKKIISFVLILALALSLSVSALAAPEICRSNQSLEINGKAVACTAYNIDGYNYFRLRELASLLAGTENRFNVNYDEATDTVYIIPHEDYADPTPLVSYNMPNEPVTTEPYFCPSVQNLIFDGCVVKTIDAWNISGNNYFKLADLAGLIGFALAYDEATRTVKITTYETKAGETAVNAADYADVYQAIRTSRKGRDYPAAAKEAPAYAESDEAEVRSVNTAAGDAGGVYGDYSGTNVQVEGIDEGDIVKTDGNYIYILRDSTELTILKAEGEKTHIVSRSDIGWYSYSEDKDVGYTYSSEYKTATQMFISNGKLAVISDYNHFNEYKDDHGWTYDEDSYVCVDIYDVSNPAAPTLISGFGQDGYVRDTRMMDGKVYVISDYWVRNEVQEDPTTYVPLVRVNGKARLIGADCIYIAPECSSSEYVVICSYDLQNAAMEDSVSALGGCDQLYMSDSSIYVFDSAWKDEETKHYRESVYDVVEHRNTSKTTISRFDPADHLKLAATGTVPGYLDSQFSADEYNGYLRLVTTRDDSTYRIYEDAKYGFANYRWDDDKTSNGLYVLDKTLHTVGKVDDLAGGEFVYSARFDGDIAYFCTYRSVDPLFAVDVSNPAAPKVLSELKISGFSEYLHAWGKDRLFGFGRETNEETGWNEGLKLVMFNTADKTNVTVENYYVLDAYYSEALYNHKAFFIDAAKNLIGFVGDGDYYIFTYSPEHGFKELSHFWFDTYEYNVRGLWIGDWAYILGSEEAMLLNMKTWDAPVPMKLSK